MSPTHQIHTKSITIHWMCIANRDHPTVPDTTHYKLCSCYAISSCQTGIPKHYMYINPARADIYIQYTVHKYTKSGQLGNKISQSFFLAPLLPIWFPPELTIYSWVSMVHFYCHTQDSHLFGLCILEIWMLVKLLSVFHCLVATCYTNLVATVHHIPYLHLNQVSW